MRAYLQRLILTPLLIFPLTANSLSIITVTSDSKHYNEEYSSNASEKIHELQVYALASALKKYNPDILIIHKKFINTTDNKIFSKYLDDNWTPTNIDDKSNEKLGFTIFTLPSIQNVIHIEKKEIVLNDNTRLLMRDYNQFSLTLKKNETTVGYGLLDSSIKKTASIDTQTSRYSKSLSNQDAIVLSTNTEIEKNIINLEFCEPAKAHIQNLTNENKTLPISLLMESGLEKNLTRFHVNIDPLNNLNACGIYINDDFLTEELHQENTDIKISGLNQKALNSIGVSIFKDKSAHVNKSFEEFAGLFRVEEIQPQFIRVSTGNYRVFTHPLDLTFPLTKNITEKLSEGLMLQAFLGIEQGSENEIPYVVFDPSTTIINPENQKVNILIPPSAFSKNKLTEGEYQAIIILAYIKKQ